MKPSLPKGTRDFYGKTYQQRQFLINKLKTAFEVFGFEGLETPSFENLSTLSGKYGDEGERLIFKILNSGDFLKEISDDELKNTDSSKLTSKICDKALRYDLTVPLARFVSQHYGVLSFPFKRYQIQPVWRADRPQKGRFREFYQCDADIVGSTSLLQELDLILLYDFFFHSINLPVEIHINHRKILQGIADFCGISENFKDLAVALDKWDKIGKEKVFEELSSKGIKNESIQKLEFFLEENLELEKLKELLNNSLHGKNGCDDIDFILKRVHSLGLKNSLIHLNLTLARGLDYYTGCIFEVKAQNINLGSIGGGGRYDNLTEIFGVKNLPGVGISFGLDRIHLAMEELKLFPKHQSENGGILFFNLGEEEVQAAFSIMLSWRAKGVRCDVFHQNQKFAKQFEYAERKQFAFVGILGEEELRNNLISIKNLSTGEQKTLNPEEAFEWISSFSA